MAAKINKITSFFTSGPLWVRVLRACITAIVGIVTFFVTVAGFYNENKEKPKVRITGMVIDRITKVPVRASVRISRPIKAEADVDNKGRFRFDIEKFDSDTVLFIVFNKQNNKDTLIERYINTDDKNISIDFLIDNLSKNIFADQVKDEIKQKKDLTPVSSAKNDADDIYAGMVNLSEKADFALIIKSANKPGSQLQQLLKQWLRNSGSVSVSALQASFIEMGLFDQVLNGNTAILKRTDAGKVIKYACLVTEDIKFEKSDFSGSLINAVCNYEVLIVDAITGNVIDRFPYHEKAADISKEKALQRVEELFKTFLESRKIGN